MKQSSSAALSVMFSVNMAIRHKHLKLVNDVLIALTARSLGATLYTAAAIRDVRDFVERS